MLHPKYERLVSIIRNYESGIVALSGGVDSTLVARASLDALGSRALAVTGDSPSLPPGELQDARRVASEIGIRHHIIETHELENPDYKANPINRCYFCKSELFDKLTTFARDQGYATVISGDHADDVGQYRPGRKAAEERSIRFPLQEADLGKEEIRLISKDLNLPTWDRPASPCLASRVAYGDPIDPEWLSRINVAETYIRNLGFKNVRVRHHKNLARIEVDPAQVPDLLEHRTDMAVELESLGWTFVTIDLTGYRSGSLNRVHMNVTPSQET